MKKILISVIAAIIIFAFLVPVILEKIDGPSTNKVNQKRVDNSPLVSAEKERKFIESRILGISHLTSVFANTASILPAVLRDEALDDQRILSATKTSLETVINLLDKGNTEAADNAYQLIVSKTLKATTESRERRNKLRNDFRAALNEYYRNGLIYTEPEWEALKSSLRGRLLDRNTQAARRAYLMQPADNAQFDYLKDQLEVLGETEQLLFFYKLNYEVSYELVKSYGALSSALDYGLALHRFTEDNERVIKVLKDPITQVMSPPTIDVIRYSEPLKAYLSALKKQGNEQEFERFSQTIIDSIKNNILTLDKKVENTTTMPPLIPSVKADFRIRGASLLHELDIVDEAILLVKDAKKNLDPKKSLDAQKVEEINLLIEQYQQSSKKQ